MEHNRELKSPRTVRSILAGTRLSRLKLGIKIGMAITSLLLLALFILVLVAGLKQRSASISTAYKTLSLAENIKKQHLEDELNHLQNQIRSFATDSRTLGAFGSLLQAFRDLESDNFYTTDAGSMDIIRQKLENYYITQVIPAIEAKTAEVPDPKMYLSDDPKQTILQFLYLASNTKSLDQKQDVLGAGDGSLYSGIHVQHQPWLLTYARQNKISNIYFVDSRSGYVFYSLKKYPDFGTSLFTGLYRNSFLSDAFRRAISDPSRSAVIFSDMDRRIPGVIPPCFYLSTPLTQGNQVIGAVIFSIEADGLDKIMTINPSAGPGQESGISTFILGSDLKYRSNDPDFLNNKTQYLKKLKHFRISAQEVLNIGKSACTAMNLQVPGNAFPDAALGMSGQGKFTTPSGKPALCSYTPVIRPGLNWILVTQASRSELLRPARSLVRILVVAALALLLTGILFSITLSRNLASRVEKVSESLSSLVYKKDEPGSQSLTGDEIDSAYKAVHELKERIGEAAYFASQLTEGKLDTEFVAGNENDIMGLSLNKLRESMIETRREGENRKTEDDIRNWTAHGIATFNDILRQDNNDMKKLSFNVIKSLIQYLDANQGGFFLLEENPEEGQYLTLISAYAYDRQKFMQKKIRIGEGLAGNCVQEKQTIHLRDIPDNYTEIKSGLGGSVPRSLVIVPLKKEDQITGVIEIASFNQFRKHEIEFMEKVAESIASTIVTVRLHEQTTQLLEESKKRSEEVSQQEEELRQNLEELKATQEEMARIRKDEEEKEKERRINEQSMMEKLEVNQHLLAKEKMLLDALLNNFPENIYFKDLQSRFIRFSSHMLKLFKLEKPEDLIGKSDFDMFDAEHSRPAYEDEQKIISTGKGIVDKIEKEVMPDGRINYVNTTKMPLYDENNRIIGTFGISKNVTSFVNMQHEIEKNKTLIRSMEEEIKMLQDEIKELKKGLKKT
jgi:PAS domain S-box-containing protein